MSEWESKCKPCFGFLWLFYKAIKHKEHISILQTHSFSLNMFSLRWLTLLKKLWLLDIIHAVLTLNILTGPSSSIAFALSQLFSCASRPDLGLLPRHALSVSWDKPSWKTKLSFKVRYRCYSNGYAVCGCRQEWNEVNVNAVIIVKGKQQ